jgi:hypothetical protein
MHGPGCKAGRNDDRTRRLGDAVHVGTWGAWLYYAVRDEDTHDAPWEALDPDYRECFRITAAHLIATGLAEGLERAVMGCEHGYASGANCHECKHEATIRADERAKTTAEIVAEMRDAIRTYEAAQDGPMDRQLSACQASNLALQIEIDRIEQRAAEKREG